VAEMEKSGLYVARKARHAGNSACHADRQRRAGVRAGTGARRGR
jgi:hypothetical protein